jgi:hypothetical protein
MKEKKRRILASVVARSRRGKRKGVSLVRRKEIMKEREGRGVFGRMKEKEKRCRPGDLVCVAHRSEGSEGG